MKDPKITTKTIFLDDESTEKGIAKRVNYLIIIFGREDDLGKEMEITRDTVVGRSLKSDFVTSDPLMSRQHFKLSVKDGKVYVEDLNSLNGTYLNQKFLKGKTVLNSGDIITAGRTVFKFECRTELESLFHKYLYNAATSDRMTNLFNKYYFITQIKREVSYAKRYGKTFSLLMVDIDDFKKVNDSHGHQVGDETLKFVAFKIMNSIRENDIAARYGGEEFAIILPEADAKSAYMVGERMRSMVESEILELDDVKIDITISVGVATFPDDANNWESLIKIADKRLYLAKEMGKNKVIGQNAHR